MKLSTENKCPDCGSEESEPVDKTYNFRKCSGCGTKFAFRPKKSIKVGKP